MTRKYFNYIVTREWNGQPTMQFGLKVQAYNILEACDIAWKVITRRTQQSVDLFNSDYEQPRYTISQSDNKLLSGMFDLKKGICIMAYKDIKLLSDEEYNALDDSVDKSFLY